MRRIQVLANEHALEFYESAGFIAFERVALNHGTAVRMTLTLNDP